jgi:hypothetical protein
MLNKETVMVKEIYYVACAHYGKRGKVGILAHLQPSLGYNMALGLHRKKN